MKKRYVKKWKPSTPVYSLKRKNVQSTVVMFGEFMGDDGNKNKEVRTIVIDCSDVEI